MRENKVVYGLIGYGGMGRWHTEILSNVSEAVIGGIYDIKEEKREEAKEKGRRSHAGRSGYRCGSDRYSE